VRRRVALLAVLVPVVLMINPADALACGTVNNPCPPPTEVSAGSGSFDVASLADGPGGIPVASKVSPDPWPAYRYRLITPCQAADDNGVGCQGGLVCDPVDGRVIQYLVSQRQALVRPADTAPGDVANDAALAAGLLPGTSRSGFVPYREGCVDITDLNPAPTPAEVFAYFQTLPLPQLATSVQPPGGTVLVGLPTIFFTDAPTQQVFTVDIRGFTVAITAEARQFTWHTGDGAGAITSDGPGAPYPNQTVTHDYTSGTYTTYVTVTWGGTFTVDGSAPVEVGGTTTTDGPPVQLTAVQARAVLTNPYD